MASTLLFLSDLTEDLRDLVPEFPLAGFRMVRRPLKTTESDDLIPIHPDLLVIDGVGDIQEGERAVRRLALAWEAGLPPMLVVVDQAGMGRFRFEYGADDFVMGTATMEEIEARLAMIDRRTGRADDATVLKVGDLTVNPENYQVYVHGRPLDLTYKEFELLKFLAQRPGRVCDRDMLLREVWGYDYYGGTRTVDVHIRRLRAKLGPEHEALIGTIRNVGYRLVPRPRDRDH
ncbi:MAG: response regulator transcription factor [Actinomycetota bacterium]